MDKILLKENIRIYYNKYKNEVESVWIIKIDSLFGISYTLLCTSCQKLIGIYTTADFIEEKNFTDEFEF